MGSSIRRSLSLLLPLVACSPPARDSEAAEPVARAGAPAETVQAPAIFGGRAPHGLGSPPEEREAEASGDAAAVRLVVVALARREESLGWHPAPAGVPLEAGWTSDALESSSLRALTTSETDAGGRAEVRLPAPSGSATQAWVRPAGPGWQRKLAYVRRKGDEPEVRLRFLVPGGTLEGRVVDAEGSAAAGARVTLRNRDSASSAATSSSATTDEEGRFHVHFGGAGIFDLVAGASRLGSGRLAELALGTDAVPAEVEVRLTGVGELAGRVVDPGGVPVPGLPLRLAPAELDESRSIGPGISAGDGRGLLADETTTDAEGRFHFTGLVPGSYRVSKRRSRRHPLDALPFPTGSTDLRLIDPSTYLHVRVAGTRATGDERQPDLRCETAKEGRVLDRGPWGLGRRPWFEQGDGSRLFEVEPGGQYVVSAMAEAWTAEVVVDVPASVHRFQTTLVPGEARGSGKLVVVLEDPGGAPYLGFHQTRVRLELGSQVAERETGWGHSTCRYGLPAGRYRIAVTTHPELLCGDGGPYGPEFPPVERSVDVLAGQTTRVAIRFPLTGSLSVRWGTPSDEPARRLAALWMEAEPSSIETLQRFWVSAEDELDVARISLMPLVDGAAGAALEPDFVMRRPAYGAELPWVPRGSSCESLVPIPVGAYEVRVDGRALRRIDVTAGQATRIVLDDASLER